MFSATVRKRLLWGVLLFLFAYALLLIPEMDPPIPALPMKQPFVWNQDARWKALEQQFVALRAEGCGAFQDRLDDSLARMKDLVVQTVGGDLPADSRVFDELEATTFHLAPMVGVCTDHVPEYLGLIGWMRSAVKDQSSQWKMDEPFVRQRLYRLLYGGRAAAEEVLLQLPRSGIPPLLAGDDEPSQTPSASVLGVTIHSGDILVSRGGAPTSALIARGSDYPGNFSHIGLVAVDQKTGIPSVIEAHIERGSTISTLQRYLDDVKLRVMVLRLRSDLPAMVADPMLPEKAAEVALARVRRHHIPYDFPMDRSDTTAMFCSEVVSSAYQSEGISLWPGLSTISTRGVAVWLSDFGVRHFETEEPSDLEYDPQLRVVAEWRDPETLFKDHVDNAIVDALLEGAERGDEMGFAWFLLPVARIVKLYSLVLNAFGRIGPIPEGMTATAALRHLWFTAKHEAIKVRVLRSAEEFWKTKGYSPPYWELLRMAREAKDQFDRP